MKRPMAASLGVGCVGAVLVGLQWALERERALLAYTGGFAFCISTALGALIFICIVNAAHVVWVIPLRRLLEAIAGTMPIFLLLFLPVALGTRLLYPWAHSSAISDQHIQRQLEHVRKWMNPASVTIRAYVYLSLWTMIAVVLRRASLVQDESGRDDLTERQRTVGAAMIPLLAVTSTLAAFDWFMSLVPGWGSDMYGVYFFAGGFVGSIGLTAVLTWTAKRAALLPRAVGAAHFSAIGRILLTSVIFWSYIAVVTVILIWVADLPREGTFLSQRVAGAWASVSGLLVFGHFLIPFLALLSRSLKRHGASLALVGAWLLLMHAFDIYWLVVPSFGEPPHLLDVGGFLFASGLVFAFGLWLFSLGSPFPIRDPNLARALRYRSE